MNTLDKYVLQLKCFVRICQIIAEAQAIKSSVDVSIPLLYTFMH